MAVRSDTVSSASPSKARMRNRVASPAALRVPLRISNDRWAAMGMGGRYSRLDRLQAETYSYLYTFKHGLQDVGWVAPAETRVIAGSGHCRTWPGMTSVEHPRE